MIGVMVKLVMLVGIHLILGVFWFTLHLLHYTHNLLCAFTHKSYDVDTSFFLFILKVLWLVKFYWVIKFGVLNVSGQYFICCVVTSEIVLCLGIYALLTMMKEQSHSGYLQCFIISIIIVQC